jgi:hypothetical protein
MNMAILKEFVCLESRKRELDAELKAITARIDCLEQTLVPQFVGDGVASIKVDGRTVCIAQEIHATPRNSRAEVIGSLKNSKLSHHIFENYNSRSFRAFVREVAEAVRLRCHEQCVLFTEAEVLGALPSPLRDTLKISFVHSLRSRKA